MGSSYIILLLSAADVFLVFGIYAHREMLKRSIQQNRECEDAIVMALVIADVLMSGYALPSKSLTKLKETCEETLKFKTGGAGQLIEDVRRMRAAQNSN